PDSARTYCIVHKYYTTGYIRAGGGGSRAAVLTIPFPISFLHPLAPPGFTVFWMKNCLTFAGVRFGLAGSKGKMLRTAATTPAMTGQAAEVPLSGSPLPNASDPRKCVYAAISGLLLNRVPGPRLEYPTKVWFVSTPATQMTSGCEFAPVIVRA